MASVTFLAFAGMMRVIIVFVTGFTVNAKMDTA